MAEARSPRRGAFTVAGGILLSWMVVLGLENLGVGLGYRDLFAGSWEMALARKDLSPIALAALFPFAVIASLVGKELAQAETSRASRAGVAILAGACGGAVAYGVSFGRHFASWAWRAPFVVGVGGAAALAAWGMAPRAARLSRTSPRALAAVAAILAALSWWTDAHVLPRLYPAFHVAMVALTLAFAAALTVLLRASSSARYASWGAIGVALSSLAWAPHAAAAVRTSDNLRMVLTEHAPLLGRAVRIATWLAPPPDDSAVDEGTLTAGVANSSARARSLDWTGHDILLVSIDALRADHVGAYGYARATTPHLDALAREGAIFRAAYCPTPHTSYSITSMMTGKYMRPLLALGVGEDSETWASYARQYGYRTAAFYPPAVFFIDAPRFIQFEKRGLDFEYRKVEFASPSLRAEQVDAYVKTADPGTPLFMWVHFFEPHEPYVFHPEHPFGTPGDPTDVDAYDSEIAATDDGLGAIVAAFRAKRPGAIVIVTADHGEEFGDHGGHYHGTTVYEEQVRVPLVIAAPGLSPRTIAAPVQTIDLLPTVLSALGVPRPPRLRGRDLGPLLADAHAADADADPGAAFVETDDYTLYARADERLVCARKAAACALYDVARDPHETHDLSVDREVDARDLKKATRALERDAARYETGAAADLPDALRRGIMGDRDAATDVAALLDDANAALRRRAAEVLFRLHAKETAPALQRALARDEDAMVQRFAALALVRLGDAPDAPARALAVTLLGEADVAWRRRAALALAEQGDARGEGELVRQWAAEGPPAAGLAFDDARELLAAMATVHAKDAAPVVARSLSDVRLRPEIADALGALGDARARAPLTEAFAEERYVSARPHEARALVRLGARSELFAPLARFAGIPEPMHDAIAIARDAGILAPDRGGWATQGAPSSGPRTDVDVTLAAPHGPGRVLVLVASRGDAASPAPRVALDGASVVLAGDGDVSYGPIASSSSSSSSPPASRGGRVAVHVEAAGGVLAVWLVPLAEEIAPPAPRAWRAGDGGADEPR